MAEKIVSPGVFTRENDLSFLQTGVAAIGTAFVGPFKEGPLVPTVVNTQSEFEQLYGTVDDTYYTPLAVVEYLRESGQAVVARVSGYGGYTQLAPQAIKAGGSIIGILFSTTASGETPGATFTHNTGSFSATVGGESLTGISLYNTNPTNIGSVFGSDAQGGKKAYAYGYFPNKAAALSSSVLTTSDFTLDNQYFPTEAQEAKTPYILSQDISGERYKLFRFETISGGTAANTKIKIALTNIKRAGGVPGTNYSTFTVVVRQLGDTNKRKLAIESYSNVNLDPNSVNYINRVIGDRKVSYDATTGKVTETGDWINRSKYIRMVSPQADTNLEPEKIPVQCAPFGHSAYYSIIAGESASAVPPVTFISASSTQYGGIDLDNKVDNLNYLKPIPTDSPSSTVLPTGSNQLFGLDTVDGGNLTLTSDLDTDIAKRNFLVAFQGGFDGQSPAIKNLKGDDETIINTQGFDCSGINTSGSIAYKKQFAALSNAEEFDIQLMVTPGLNQKYHSDLIKAGMTMIQDRADAFYIIDATPINGEITDAIESAKAYDTSYGAMYYPWVKTLDPITGKLVSIPATALIPGMYAANDRTAGEWFAPAGLNRGGLRSAIAVIRKCNQTDRDNLYENKVNPIVIFANQGVVAFGQKTLQTKPSALDRINVRRLMLTIRKFVASTSRYLVFEQNDPKTRESFVNIVTPYLASIQHARGIYAFKVIMDESNNTPDLVDRGILKGSIYLQPSKVAEFIQIDFNILPTGATFGG